MTITVFGIPNCDTVRKARKWLEQQQFTFAFHDIRKQPVATATIEAWLEHLGTEKVINKRSTSWRELTPEQQQLASTQQVVELLQQHPTLMKRPLLASAKGYSVGFNVNEWEQLLEVTQ